MEQAMEPSTDRPKSPKPAGRSIGRILVGVDGSESADAALHIAAEIAHRYSAEIDLMHVRDTHSEKSRNQNSAQATFTKQNSAVDPNTSEQRDNPESSTGSDPELLLSKRKGLLETRGIRVQTIAVSSTAGSVGEEIVRTCNDGDYDLLAVGSRGLGRARSFVLGSVSKKVVAEAKCTVLVSKARIDSIKRILLAYDGSEGSKKAQILVVDLAQRFNALVNVISAMSEPMLSSELDLYGAVDRLDREMSYYSNEAATKLKEMQISSESSKVVGGEKISNAIVKEAEEGLYDIVALGTRGWGRAKSILLGSVASSVLDSSKVNVLIVK